MRILQSLFVMSLLAGGGSTAIAKSSVIKAGIPHKSDEKIVEVYGHRGDRAFAPENSMPAYATALKVGVDWVDMDVGVTKDGEVVVYHDIWLNPDFTSKDGRFFASSNKAFVTRMGGGKDQLLKPYLLNNLTFKQLQEYDIGHLNPDSPYASYFPDQYSIPDTKIPSLQQVVDYVDLVTKKQVMYQIEIKNDPSYPQFTLSAKELASKVYQVLKKNNLINRAEIQAFDWEVLYQLQALDSKIKTAYLIGYDEIDANHPETFKVGGLWSGGKMIRNYNNSLPQMIKALGGSCYEPEDVILTKKDLDEAHKLGLKVVVWTWPEHSGTAFNYQLVDKLIAWGVDGIIVDDPARLNSMLAARGYRIPNRYE